MCFKSFSVKANSIHTDVYQHFNTFLRNNAYCMLIWEEYCHCTIYWWNQFTLIWFDNKTLSHHTWWEYWVCRLAKQFNLTSKWTNNLCCFSKNSWCYQTFWSFFKCFLCMSIFLCFRLKSSFVKEEYQYHSSHNINNHNNRKDSPILGFNRENS